MASTCASSDTSQRMASVLWPWATNSLAADCAASSFQSASTTEAPDSANALAVARPNPDAAPVTSATLFSKDMIMTSSSVFEWVISRFLVEHVPFALDIRYIDFVGPILGIDLFERNRHDFFFSVQDAHDVFHDHFGKLVLLLFRTSGGKFHDNMGHDSLLGSLFGALLKHFFDDRQCGEDIGPTCIERQLCEHFRSLFLRQATVHRSIEVIANLRHLSGCNEGADRHQAAVSGRQSRTQPKVTEKHIGGVLDNARRDCAEILLDAGCA